MLTTPPGATTGRALVVKVHGTPAPQGSKVAIPIRKGPKGARVYTGRVNLVESSKAVGPWRDAVRAETQRAVLAETADWIIRDKYPLTVPVHVTLTFRLPRPAGHYGTGRNADTLRPAAPAFPARKPDLDKLARAVLDGITAGGALADDALVVSMELFKLYAEPGESPGATILINWDASA